MINTRLSIFKTLKKALRELTKHGKQDPVGFKDILYAVILNDMREWSLYIPNNDMEKLDQILQDYLLEHGIFQIERILDEPKTYRNVNTPQDNTTWSRIWDKKDVKVLKGEQVEYEPVFRISGDEIIYYKGSHGEKNDSTWETEIHDNTLYEDGDNRKESSNDKLPD